MIFHEKRYSSTSFGETLALTLVPLLVGLVTSIPSSSFGTFSTSGKDESSNSIDGFPISTSRKDGLCLIATSGGLSSTSGADLLRPETDFKDSTDFTFFK
mmetsp:Transcript_17540/g.37922  ORF Transcript_17540/g.37922 Transcript_17540/m.37922 type:complete len:100 (-) Transcript_17540:3041-3340(-)